MAKFIEAGEAANDGELEVLRLLRDGLDETWYVVGNPTIQQGGRAFECDAFAVGQEGWAYLIEIKAWTGRIVGNDQQWLLPAVVGDGVTPRPNPVELTQQKARVLATVLREADNPLKNLYIQPLVVLASEEAPDLRGLCASYTVLAREAVARVLLDPRGTDFAKRKLPDDVAHRAATALAANHRPLAPDNHLGSWELIEQDELGPGWEVWSARPRLAGEAGREMRLKRYLIDPLLTGEERRAQRSRARRDLDALQRLAGADGAVPLVGAVEEVDDSFVVVTEWPNGESLASKISNGPLDAEEAQDILEALAFAVASIHRLGVTHRNLSPTCAHYLIDGRVVVTDFDYARLPATGGTVTRFLNELLGEYVAPEVREDPAEASKASDVWSIARIGLDLFGLETIDGGDVPPSVAHALQRALSEAPSDRPADADLLLSELTGGLTEPPLFEGFEPNDELDERWIVKSEPIGEGGIARVYRLYDSDTQRDYAGKFVREEYADLFDPVEEYSLLEHVPDHPCVAKPQFLERISKYQRDGRQYSFKTTFLVTRWVEGTRLDKLLRQGLAPVRCVEIVLALGDAVEHLHSHGLLHRDLKPANVIVDDATGLPRLVDFNVSRAVDAADRTRIGTPPYLPPDLDEAGWGWHADTYALGVVLCELLAAKPLRPGPGAWLAGAKVDGRLLEVLRRAVAPQQVERYASVAELATALRETLQHLKRPIKPIDPAPFPTANPEELVRPNWNPYQQRLVGLFSQSRTSNAGTRGLDDFARWAYVETKVDRELFDDIVGGRYRLVLITGNAGDGKTAFIQMLERRLVDEGGSSESRPEGNGTTLERDGHRYLTNWDASQDEGETENDAALSTFFEPVAGSKPDPPPTETRVVAINEGRLLDFVSEYRDTFPWLSQNLLAFFQEQKQPDVEWLSVVNLNLRALTLPGEDGESVVAQLLHRFSDQRIWEPCQGCAAQDLCYANANAAVLRDPVLGPRSAERIRQTFDLVRLRRRLHITMRDLRSALAFVVAGNRTCSEIVTLVEDQARDDLLAGHLYNSLFAASDKLRAPARSPEAGSDRLLGVVGTLDVAKTSDPEVDARLWAVGIDAIRPDPETLQRQDRLLLMDLRDRLPRSPRELIEGRAKSDLRLLQSSLRRKFFMEREDPGWLSMYPYDRLDVFLRQVGGFEQADRAAIVRAISNSEGLFDLAFAGDLGVRLVGENEGADRSFVIHSADDFRLTPLDRSAAADYVEYAPDVLELRHVREPSLSLEIDLDLYEMLTRVLEGFTPSREELRGAWLNLSIFKNQLATIPSESLLLSRDDLRFHRVFRVDGEVAVQVEQVG